MTGGASAQPVLSAAAGSHTVITAPYVGASFLGFETSIAVGCGSQHVTINPGFRPTTGAVRMGALANGTSCAGTNYSLSEQEADVNIRIPINLTLIPNSFRVDLRAAVNATWNVKAGLCGASNSTGSCGVSSFWSAGGDLNVVDLTTNTSVPIRAAFSTTWSPAPANGSTLVASCISGKCSTTLTGPTVGVSRNVSPVALYILWPHNIVPVATDSYALELHLWVTTTVTEVANLPWASGGGSAAATLQARLVSVGAT